MPFRAQNLMKLEEAQRRLEAQCGHEPTLPEWAQAVGMSCKELQSSIHIGRRCREKMARSNFRLVIHVARKYQGYGLDIEDLVQVNFTLTFFFSGKEDQLMTAKPMHGNILL